MGYTTEFSGAFSLSRALTQEESNYLKAFSGTRRMKRDPEALMAKYGGLHGLDGKYGTDGEYFAYDDGDAGQSEVTGVGSFNDRPGTQPGLWCQWVPTEDGTGIEWDGGEKFYNYTEWLEYIVENFLKPWGIVANGSVNWVGEDEEDRGVLSVRDNVITAQEIDGKAIPLIPDMLAFIRDVRVWLMAPDLSPATIKEFLERAYSLETKAGFEY